MSLDFNEVLQTTKASLSVGGMSVTFGLAALVDIVSIFAVLTGLILGIYTIFIKKRNDKRDESKANSDEARAQELHQLRIDKIKNEK